MLVLSSWGMDRATRGFSSAINNANCYVKRGAFQGSSSLNTREVTVYVGDNYTGTTF